MPPAPKSPQSRRSGQPKSKGAVRAKSGCYTCRIRRKKCDEQRNGDDSCATCTRLRLQCLGFGAKRPEWLRENRNVLDLREKIKTFLASQGMIKGHSGSAPRAAEHEPHILALSSDYTSPSNSPQTPTLSISSTNDDRPSLYPLRTDRYENDRLLPIMQESPDSPLDRSEILLPAALPYSSTPVNNSLDPWPNHSLVLQRPHLSEFSRLHNVHIPSEEEDFDVVSSNYMIVPAPALDQYLFPGLDDRENAALNYYMEHVLRMQYLHASKSLDFIIWNLIHTSPNARQAACLLSNLHRRCIERNTIATIEPQDLETLRSMQIVPSNRPLTEGDALAGLCIVSYFLFSGGKGQWQTFLDAAATFSLNAINYFGGPCDALRHCSESVRFIIKTSIWFDVLASATLLREPHFLGVIRELYGPRDAFFNDEPTFPLAEYSMMSVMGCDNHIVLALAEIASLAHWKAAHVSANDLSNKELVRRGNKIEELLKKPSSQPSDWNESPERALQRRLTSEVFRASAHVYLHSVISGDYPKCPEIVEAINNTVECLKEAEDEHTGRAVVRSVVFSICICGCLTENPDHREYFLKRLEEQQGLAFGNSQQVRGLILDVWRQPTQGPVNWRQVMSKAEILLV